jgi:hypothetical protein
MVAIEQASPVPSANSSASQREMAQALAVMGSQASALAMPRADAATTRTAHEVATSANATRWPLSPPPSTGQSSPAPSPAPHVEEGRPPVNMEPSPSESQPPPQLPQPLMAPAQVQVQLVHQQPVGLSARSALKARVAARQQVKAALATAGPSARHTLPAALASSRSPSVLRSRPAPVRSRTLAGRTVATTRPGDLAVPPPPPGASKLILDRVAHASRCVAKHGAGGCACCPYCAP